jgi:uncharacterized protein (DUF2249 family)/iron-sulfur cluster repair protein YtfE (RIC family)
MNNVVLATNREDAEAAEAVERHHAEMAGALGALVDSLRRAAVAADQAGASVARERLVEWLERELVPHALAEEKAMYPAAQELPEGRLLVTGMLAEHKVITDLVRDIAAAPDAVTATASAYALKVMFDSHLAKENDLVLPLLVATPHVSVAVMLDGMHELLGGSHAAEESAGCGGHTCGCGEVDGPGYPELDARAVPHAIRHATIFGALEAVPSGGGLVLVAPHDPLPLLTQVQERFSGAFEVEYLQRGPEDWRLLFSRSA